MKKYFFPLLLSLLTSPLLHAQIKFSNTAAPIIEEKVVHYDSTRNFVGENVKALVGQELYLLPYKVKNPKYFDLFKTYEDTKKNFPHNTVYEDYAGKTFIVEEILPSLNQFDPEGESILKLRDKNSGRECYYRYSSKYPRCFEFIVMGYYEKEKKKCIGKQIVLKNKNWRNDVFKDKAPVYDCKTGKEVNIDIHEPWTIQDLSIEDQYYTLSYTISNSKGESLTVDVISVNDYNRGNGPCALFLNDTLRTIKEKQPKFYEAIMNDEIMVGMNKQMVRYAWGSPESISNTSYNETWLYRSQFLYFKNDILESFH